jgi:nicotinate-nucleotide adenylyltransferase
MKVGIFGGTFNPPHMGHLIVAEWAREVLQLDKILFVPAAVSPHKIDLDIVEAHHRLEMLSCAIQGNRYFDFTDLEVQRGGISFTVDTLQVLKERHQDDVLVLLIGADNLLDFHTWKDPETILALAEVVVLTRPGFVASADEGYMKRVSLLEVPEIAIESRQIRRRVKEGRSIRYLVPFPVEVYIQKNGMYR